MIPFPEHLHLALAEMEKVGQADIASWQSHGRCFMVHSREKFVKQILPRWFRMTKFESFQRQLNVYGFTRICFGPDKGSYYHDNFVRGQPMLAMEIQRSPVNGKGPRRRADPTTTPNFYATSASPAPVLCTHNHPSTPTHRPRCSPEPLQRKCPALNRTVSLLQADGCLLKQLPRRQLLSQPHEEHEEDNGCLPPLPPAAVRTVHGSFSLSEYLSGLFIAKTPQIDTMRT